MGVDPKTGILAPESPKSLPILTILTQLATPIAHPFGNQHLRPSYLGQEDAGLRRRRGQTRHRCDQGLGSGGHSRGDWEASPVQHGGGLWRVWSKANDSDLTEGDSDEHGILRCYECEGISSGYD